MTESQCSISMDCLNSLLTKPPFPADLTTEDQLMLAFFSSPPPPSIPFPAPAHLLPLLRFLTFFFSSLIIAYLYSSFIIFFLHSVGNFFLAFSFHHLSSFLSIFFFLFPAFFLLFRYSINFLIRSSLFPLVIHFFPFVYFSFFRIQFMSSPFVLLLLLDYNSFLPVDIPCKVALPNFLSVRPFLLSLFACLFPLHTYTFYFCFLSLLLCSLPLPYTFLLLSFVSFGFLSALPFIRLFSSIHQIYSSCEHVTPSFTSKVFPTFHVCLTPISVIMICKYVLLSLYPFYVSLVFLPSFFEGSHLSPSSYPFTSLLHAFILFSTPSFLPCLLFINICSGSLFCKEQTPSKSQNV